MIDQLLQALRKADLLVGTGSGSICRDCGTERDRHGAGGRCNKCYKRVRGRLRRSALVQAYGKTCKICELEYPTECFDLHHVETKTFSLKLAEIAGRSAEEIATEAAKCVLLCANCHRTLHRDNL